MEDLKRWREVLDGLDITIVRTLVQRESVSIAIGKIKRDNNLETNPSSREQEVVERIADLYSKFGGQHQNPRDYLARIYANIFEQSRGMQNEIPYQNCSKV